MEEVKEVYMKAMLVAVKAMMVSAAQSVAIAEFLESLTRDSESAELLHTARRLLALIRSYEDRKRRQEAAVSN
jgi:hypothetical protein